MTLISICLKYIMNPENVKVNSKIIAEKKTIQSKQNGKMIYRMNIELCCKGILIKKKFEI